MQEKILISLWLLILALFWAPETYAFRKKRPNTYDTSERYHLDQRYKDMGVSGNYELERRTNLIQYPKDLYPIHRIRIQDQILNKLYKNTGKVSPKPRIIFTAGPFASGKSTALGLLKESGYYSAEDFVHIDPDKIRDQLPEFKKWSKKGVLKAGRFTQNETMLLSDLQLERSLRSGKNIIFDSSLRDYRHFKALFERIKKMHPEYQIEVVHVKGLEEKIFQASIDRDKKFRRKIPPDEVRASLKDPERSVKKLNQDQLIDVTLEIDNAEADSKLESITTRFKTKPVGKHIKEVSSDVFSELKGLPQLIDHRQHLIYDIDYTIVSPIPPTDLKHWQIVEVNGEYYRVADHLDELVHWINSKPNYAMSFSSGGTYNRNLELLKKIKPPSLKGKSLFDIAFEVQSLESMEKIAHPISAAASDAYRKPIEKINPSPNHRTLIDDDVKNLAKVKGGKSHVDGNVYHVETFEELEALRKFSPNDPFIPKNKTELWLSRNRLARELSILKAADAEAAFTGRSFTQLVTSKSKLSPEYWTERGLGELFPEVKPCDLKRRLLNLFPM